MKTTPEQEDDKEWLLIAILITAILLAGFIREAYKNYKQINTEIIK